MTRRSPIELDGDAWSCKGYVGEDWLLRRAFAEDTKDVHGWYPARVPGSVVADLVRVGEVPDPDVDRGSLACEWVATRTWVYRRTFVLDGDASGAELVLDGVDHSARIYVNGTFVGHHVGAFTTATFAVAHLLRPGANLLAVVLDPAPDGQPHIGRTDLVRTTKSRMTYGWDFSPRLVHVGICDRVRIAFPAPIRIRDLFARPEVDREADTARLRWRTDLAGQGPGPVTLTLELRRRERIVASARETVELVGGEGIAEGVLEVEDVELWWPNGEGAQPLYGLTAHAVADVHEDVHEVRVGFRSIRLAPNEGAPEGARDYTLTVNGRRIYVQGWNWVPMDLHHGIEDPDRLEHHLRLAVRAGANLLRVWGGGPIERTSFYDACDRLGLLIWQEFPLSSSLHGSVPASDQAYVDTVVSDARRIIPRRRNHASLALWCGGNELDGDDGLPARGGEPVLAALEAAVRELDPDRVWLPTSPTGPVATCTRSSIAADPDGLHDVHGPWEHQGLHEHRALYDGSTSLFHSEFGVEGMADVATIEGYLGEGRRWPADRSNRDIVHRGDFWINTPLLVETFGAFDDLPSLVAASQLLQADGLRYAIEANRRRQWRQSGSIPWQLGEPFPNVFCTSAVDHAGRAKPAYHAVAEAYADLLVSARLPTQVWADQEHLEAQAWVSSRATSLPGATVEVAARDAAGTTLHDETFDADVAAGASTPVGSVRWPRVAAELFWLDLTLRDTTGTPQATNRYLNAAGRDLRALRDVEPAELEIDRDPDGHRLEIRNVGRTVAVGVTARDARPVPAQGYVSFDGGHVTLFPGESRDIAISWIGVDDPPPVTVAAWNTGGRHVA